MAVISAGVAAATVSQAAHAQDRDWQRMLKASEAEQAAFVVSYLNRGMPVADPDGDVFTMLVLNKSSVTVPLVERKIEEVLQSPSPSQCFTEESVEPTKFVGLAASAITYAGDEQALRQASKLIRIDEKRFGNLVEHTLTRAATNRSPFILAYHGIEIGDSAVDSRIASWAEAMLADRRSPVPGAAEAEMYQVRGWWAEAMVARYKGVPTEDEWRRDPIVTRLKASQADHLHNDMIRRVSEIVEKRLKH